MTAAAIECQRLRPQDEESRAQLLAWPFVGSITFSPTKAAPRSLCSLNVRGASSLANRMSSVLW